MPGFGSGDPGGMRARSLDRDLGAGIAYADDEHATLLQLGGVPVFLRMQLEYGGVEIAGECGHSRHLVVGHGDDHVFGFKALVAGGYDKPAVLPPEPVDPDLVSN